MVASGYSRRPRGTGKPRNLQAIWASNSASDRPSARDPPWGTLRWVVPLEHWPRRLGYDWAPAVAPDCLGPSPGLVPVWPRAGTLVGVASTSPTGGVLRASGHSVVVTDLGAHNRPTRFFSLRFPCSSSPHLQPLVLRVSSLLGEGRPPEVGKGGVRFLPRKQGDAPKPDTQLAHQIFIGQVGQAALHLGGLHSLGFNGPRSRTRMLFRWCSGLHPTARSIASPSFVLELSSFASLGWRGQLCPHLTPNQGGGRQSYPAPVAEGAKTLS